MFSLVLLSFFSCAALEMAQTWQLDRLRILAAKAEPAEPQPGDSVSFSSLIYSPQDEDVESVIWFGCLPDDASSFGCTIDPSIMEQFDSPPEDPQEQLAFFQELQEAGFIGAEPDFPPIWTVPEDALDGLDEAQKIEGRSAFINITAIPSDSDQQEDIELAYRRIPVSLSDAPNQNPVIESFSINETIYFEGDVFYAKANESYDIDLKLSSDSVEEYSYINIQGEEELRTEEPYFTWYLEAGEFLQYFTLYPYNAVVWTAPSKAHQGRIQVVVRDRRGGMNWASLTVEVSE